MKKLNKQIDLIKRAEKVIEEMCSGHLTVKEIAYMLKVHPSDFVRIFRKIKGMTPKKYIDEQLKIKVMQKLTNRVTFGYKFAYELDFSSEQMFYRWVKRVFGVSFKRLCEKQINE